MGERSGEYPGKKRSRQPFASMAVLTRALLCAWRLSMTTICPAWRLGARICSTYSVVLADPSRISAAPMPFRERAAMSVIFLPQLRGTLPLARSPFGARAYKGVKAMLDPHSSITTSDSVGSLLAFARQAARSSSLRSVAPSDFFFSRPAKSFDRPAHRPAAHALTVSLSPEVTMLL